jgi:hypothetical protein
MTGWVCLWLQSLAHHSLVDFNRAEGGEKIYAAVFGIGVPRSDKARQLVPSMLSLTQGAFEVISDALQVGLLGWPRLYRRRMCFPSYRSSVCPPRGRNPIAGQVRRRGWQLLGLTVSESHIVGS